MGNIRMQSLASVSEQTILWFSLKLAHFVVRKPVQFFTNFQSCYSIYMREMGVALKP